MKRRTQDEWRELIAQQKESGLSASQFCNERDINDKYFSTIKYKLKEKSNNKQSFQALGMLSGSQSITLRSKGVDIQIPLSVDAHWLAALAKQLGQ